MISCWVLSSSSRPAGQARAAGERRQAHGHRRASQRHSPGSRGRKQDEAGCDEGQGCRRRQQQLPRQILKVFRSFQAAGDAPPPPSFSKTKRNQGRGGGAGAGHTCPASTPAPPPPPAPAPSSLSYMHFTLPCAPPCPLLSSPHTCPPPPCFSKTKRNQGREGRAVAGHTCPSSTPAPPPPSLPALTRCSECAVSLRV